MPSISAISGSSTTGASGGRATWRFRKSAGLADAGKLLAAFDLAVEAERYLPASMKALNDLRDPSFSRLATVRSDPPGATVYWNDYFATEAGWKLLGQTPVERREGPRRLQQGQD